MKEEQLCLIPHVCGVEDSSGVPCTKVLTPQELEDDGMCSSCADNLWRWNEDTNHVWSNKGA